MVVTQGQPKRKPSGGRYKNRPTKRLHRRGSRTTHTRIGEVKTAVNRTKGGGSKTRLLSVNKVNIVDPKTKKHKVAKIVTISESPANRYFARRNILTKGSVIETDMGKARVTNRPGQEGTVNAVLL